jgi:hypothetical protein
MVIVLVCGSLVPAPTLKERVVPGAGSTDSAARMENRALLVGAVEVVPGHPTVVLFRTKTFAVRAVRRRDAGIAAINSVLLTNFVLSGV